MLNLTLQSMTDYLSKSIRSLNSNKINGMLAEIELRNYIYNLGYSDRISQGGWIVRNVGADVFGEHTAVLFPETIVPDIDYNPTRTISDPSVALHTICSTMHQIGVHSYYCVPMVNVKNDPHSISWEVRQLGIPTTKPFTPLLTTITDFTLRARRYNFLVGKTMASIIPGTSIPEEFTKENLRVAFQNHFMAEVSDIDGVLWGEQHTYPIEIKEKTPAIDSQLGEYFGIDAGPFVKLAFYAAKKGNLHSLFIVKEIDNEATRVLVNWWFITFDTLAQYASWVTRAGGKNMLGGSSTVIRIPKSKFTKLDSTSLAKL